jgi:hypothetical protein
MLLTAIAQRKIELAFFGQGDSEHRHSLTPRLIHRAASPKAARFDNSHQSRKAI